MGGCILWNVASCYRNEVSLKAERGCLQDLYRATNFVWKRRIVPEKRDGSFVQDGEIHGDSNV